MRRRACLAIVVAALLGGCAGEAPALEGTPEIAKACTVRPCRCLSENVPFFFIRESAPVQWREDGDAYCPTGFVLVLRDEK